jgi:ParB-like chromosome segregation protein Spo0J
MELKVRIECQGYTTVELDEFVELHNYGKISDDHYAHGRNSIEELGFSFPFFAWESDGKKYILDGHGRRKILLRMRDEGFAIPPLPTDLVFAKDRNEAVKKLLAQESRYKDIDSKLFSEFLVANDLTVEDIGDFVDIPGLEPEREKKPKKSKMIKCPGCGFEFDKSSAPVT